MNIVKEIQHLESAVNHVPRLLALRRLLTFQGQKLVNYEKVLGAWNDGKTTPDEQRLLNIISSESGAAGETNLYRKLGRLNAYQDNTNDVLRSKKWAHIAAGNIQSYLSLVPVATLPFREAISSRFEQVLHTAGSLDTATTVGLIAASVLGLVVGLAEGQKNRQEGRIYGAQQKVLKAEVQVIKKQLGVNERNPLGRAEQYTAYQESRLKNARQVFRRKGRVS